MTSSDAQRDDGPGDHLETLADGCGCVEIWEHLSKQRDSEE